MNNYVVYCHTLKFDGRKYIGITCQTTNNRWRKNGNGYKNSIHFFRAINNYGWENFEHEVLYSNLSKKDAEELEIKLIKEFNTTNPLYGFNILNGGNTNLGFKHTEEAKTKISMALKGKSAHNKGISPSAETRIKMSLSNKGKHKPSKEHLETISRIKSKKVMCVELNRTFKNEREASLFLNGNSHICDVCKGTRKTAGGYHWQYI